MIKLWVLSDLHCELLGYPHRIDLPRPKCDVLVLAGDVDRAGNVVDKLRKMFGDRIPIVFVAGNHEHYQTGQTVQEDIDRLYQDAHADREAGRITHFLENDTVEMEVRGEPIRFIGATLWTDFKLFGNPYLAMSVAKRRMNDYALIKSNKAGVWELRPQETVEWHRESRAYIER
ncbi:MAG TPA: metallophosphoesterase, partial [Acetobacteraceae bacterium]|nr:metallophosphoesterase [Acetobacteraceae bacterium]